MIDVESNSPSSMHFHCKSSSCFFGIYCRNGFSVTYHGDRQNSIIILRLTIQIICSTLGNIDQFWSQMIIV